MWAGSSRKHKALDIKSKRKYLGLVKKKKRVTQDMANYATGKSGNYLAACGKVTRVFKLQVMRVKV